MSDRERILTATSARELFGDAVDDPRLLRRAYAKLAKQFRPDEDPQAFAALRQWFERARDGGGEVESVMSSVPRVLVLPAVGVSLSQIAESPQWVFELDRDVLEALLTDCDQVGVDLSPHVLDQVEDAVLIGLAVDRARGTETLSKAWMQVAACVFSGRGQQIHALSAVAVCHPSYVETRAALLALNEAEPELGTALYRTCAQATLSERDWWAFDRNEWSPPTHIFSHRATWKSACRLAPKGSHSMQPGLFAALLVAFTPLWGAMAYLQVWAAQTFPENVVSVIVGVPTLGLVVALVALHLGLVSLYDQHRRVARSSPMVAAAPPDGGVGDTLRACRQHGLWPHEFLATAAASGHHDVLRHDAVLRSYHEKHVLPRLQRDLALIPHALGERLLSRLTQAGVSVDT